MLTGKAWLERRIRSMTAWPCLPPCCLAVVTSVQQDEDGVVVATADGTNYTAPYVVSTHTCCWLPTTSLHLLAPCSKLWVNCCS